MATRVIDDTKLNNIAVAIQAKDSGGQMTVDEMPTRIGALPTAPTLIPKTITQNGVYNASSDNADGYDVVTVDVPQNPYEKFNQYLSGTLRYFRTDITAPAPFMASGLSADNLLSGLRYFSMKNMGGYVYNYAFSKFGNAGKALGIFGKPIWIQQDAFHNTFLRTLIFLNDSLPQLAGTLTSVNITNLKLWVFDSMVNSFKTGTNWSTYADKTFGFSEAHIYDNATTYEIGDVCQYNNKFYAYAKEDLTSSTGNPPTGTTADNDYWEYVADIEVI